MRSPAICCSSTHALRERDGLVHVAVLLPVGIEERGLVGDADVALEGGNDRSVPNLVDAAGDLF